MPVEPNRQAEDSGGQKEALLCTLQAEEGCSAPRYVNGEFWIAEKLC